MNTDLFIQKLLENARLHGLEQAEVFLTSGDSFRAMSQQGAMTLKCDCKEGDWVRVELPDNRFLSATAMAYAIPLLLFLGGLLLGNALSGGNELWAMGGSMIGLGLGVGAVWLCDRLIKGRPEWTPHVAQIYDYKPDTGVLGCGQE